MLDANILEELKTYFGDLGHKIDLVVKTSKHNQQSDLLAMLSSVASTSNSLDVKFSDVVSDVPSFSVHRDGKPTGIHFVGIPGGHEFTSLILAILNSAGKGKQPDAGLTFSIL
jgi:alkyl hydroperoxide reductase subunit F